MSTKHLRQYTLDGVNSSAAFAKFCERYGDTPMNGTDADNKIFESVFRQKASQFSKDPAMTEIYLDTMLGRGQMREARSFLDGAIPYPNA